MGQIWGAGRGLLRAPAFTALAVVTIGVGVGANAAAFAVFDAVVLRPFPFEAPEELVRVSLDLTGRGGAEREGLTPADLLDFRAEPGLFAALSGWATRDVALAGVGPAEVVPVAEVTEGMFARVLRVQPSLGRSFVPEEHRTGSAPSVLVSHALWADRLGGDVSALGRSISLDGEPHTIVGVMPEAFAPPFGRGAVAWTAARPVVERCRGCATLDVLGRLSPGSALPAAHDRADAVLQRLAEAYPVTDGGVRLRIEPLSAERARLQAAFGPLFLATAITLLLACANVAVLLVTRSGGRRAELQLRAAVGAERGQLTTHLLLEALLLAAGGALVALFAGSWLLGLVLPLAPAEFLLDGRATLDPALVGFSSALALLGVLVFGVGPAVGATRTVAGVPALRRKGGAGRRGSPAWASGLLSVQVALATTLTAGAVIGARALRDLRATDLGFEPAGVVALELAPSGTTEPRAAHGETVSAFLERLRSMPGVTSVGALSGPVSASASPVTLFRVGYESGEATTRRSAALRLVQGAYFYTLGRRVTEGRALREGDGGAGPAPVVVNESFARAFLGFPRRSALEARLAITGDGGGWRPVVGVVEDVRLPGVQPVPEVYAPHAVRPVGDMAVMISGGGDPDVVAASARGILAGVAPDVAVRRVVALPDLVDGSFAAERFTAGLLTAFAGVALLLSAVGLYAVLAQRARGRRSETGVRLALGAGPEDVQRAIATPGLRLTLAGVLAGGIASAWVTGFLEAFLPIAARLDPVAFGAAAGLLLVVSWMAAWAPTRWAARMDPASVLRDE